MPPLIRDPFPGKASPLFLSALTLAAYLHYRKNEENDFYASYSFNVLSIAATALMTTNTSARYTAVVGGMMQLYRSSASINTLGFLLQAGALGFSIREARQTLSETMPRPYRR